MLKTSWLSLALPFLLLTACSDDKSASTRSTAEIQADWNAHCEAFAACPTPADATACKAQFSCLEAALRADMLDKTAACEKARTCTTGDDACFSLEAQGLTPSAAATSFRTDCLAKRGTCTTAGQTFADDYCYSASSLEDSTIATLSTCLSGGCADVSSCYDAALAAVAPGCNN